MGYTFLNWGCTELLVFEVLATLNFVKFSFKYQKYLLSSVLCPLSELENEAL